MPCTSAPASTSSAASRSAFGVVFVYWNRPVSVTSADVQRSGDLGGQRNVELAQDVAHDLGRRGCVRDDQVDVAERRVVVMVVDVRRRASRRRPASAPGRFAARWRSRPRPARAPRSRPAASRCSAARSRKLYSPGVGASPDRYITTSLPSARSAERRREHRAERVAVGILVRRRRRSGRSTGSRPRPPAGQLRRRLAHLRDPVFLEEHASRPANLVDQLRHADAPLDGVIVGEGERGVRAG